MPPSRRRRHFDGWAAQSGRPSISFRDGFKYVDGVRYTITGTYQFMSSNGTTLYTALMWSDGKPSCNCPGWATSKMQDKFGNPKDKTCTHSKDVRVGDNVRIENGEPVIPFSSPPNRVEAAPKKRKIIL